MRESWPEGIHLGRRLRGIDTPLPMSTALEPRQDADKLHGLERGSRVADDWSKKLDVTENERMSRSRRAFTTKIAHGRK